MADKNRLIDIEVNQKQLRRIEAMLRGMPRQIPQILYRAVNKTASPAKTQISQEIRQEINIKAKDLNEKIVLQKAWRGYPTAFIRMSKKRIPVFDFAAKKLKMGGISYQIKKSGGRMQLPHAFMATMPKTGHIGVFERSKKGTRREKRTKFVKGGKVKYSTELPIVELFGPSVGEVFKRAKSLIQRITRQAYKNLERNIESQIDYVLAQRKTGRAA